VPCASISRTLLNFGGGRVRGVHHVGELNGYQEDWTARTKETIEKELKYRGIAPEVIAEIKDKIEEPSCAAACIISILATALICTLIFVAIWELTP
jgi:hypothetical protein